MNEETIKCMELMLAKIFAEGAAEKYEARAVIGAAKSAFAGIKKKEVKEARKRLGIESKEIDGEFYWIWRNKKTPEDVWAEKSNEMFGG